MGRPDSRSAARRRKQLLWRRTAVAIGAILLVASAIGFAFSGSPTAVPEGVQVAGVDVGGLTPPQAEAVLAARERGLRDAPVIFTAGGHAWRLRPSRLGVKVDWARAVDAALRQGQGPAPVRGFRRLGVRLFGADVAPPTEVYDAALSYELDRIADAVDRPHVDAALKLKGMSPVIVPGASGRALDRVAAERVIVQSLASLQRVGRVALPVRVGLPSVSTQELRPVALKVRTALSAPVRLAIGPTRFRLPRYRVAQLLDLPTNGTSTLRIGGPDADKFFVRLTRTVDRKARDADFRIGAGNHVSVIPAKDGRAVDVPATAKGLLRAALSTTNRLTPLVIRVKHPKVTTEQANAMGIHGLVGAYETFYGGDANRIHNVQLVAHLIDRHLIAPGEEFSFNKTTGERSAEKGFLEAPVIINGELTTGLGGGVCQVSTTTFNAAFVAGLKITARTNHALYISHYPQGRDATVNYPDVDLRFVNDTGHWLLLRTFVGSSSLTVALYGTNPHRKVESATAPLVVTGAARTEREHDPNLFVGERVVDDFGEPSRSTSVERKVYAASGKLLYDDTWHSSYRGEPKIVRVGTKPKPTETKPKPGTTTTGTGTTGTTATTGTVKAPPPKPTTQP